VTTPRSTWPVTRLDRARLDDAARAAARALHAEPFAREVWPDPVERSLALCDQTALLLRDGLASGGALATPELVGLGGWIRDPDARSDEAYRYLFAHVPESAAGSAIQLAWVAVDPEWRGRGIGGTILEALHADASASRRDVALLAPDRVWARSLERAGYAALGDPQGRTSSWTVWRRRAPAPRGDRPRQGPRSSGTTAGRAT